MICLDLEDSVALAEKPKGREMARDSMPGMKRTGYLMAVRVNSLQSGLLEDDLDAVVISDLEAIGLPKADDPDIIKRVDHYLTILEKTRGIPVGQVKIFPWIETAKGVIDAYALCTSSPRVAAASVGGEDLTSDMGMERTREGRELEYARNHVATACIAAGVVPLDTVFADFPGHRRVSRLTRFTGSPSASRDGTASTLHRSPPPTGSTVQRSRRSRTPAMSWRRTKRGRGRDSGR